ncbi:class I SAM-dependent methyltransferase [Enterococcus sp. AZ196]|uniref:class I SAM-dependent methyltransferase n=1 Tax=Enterococcus sp. AZ196 TaxID=2774659 RepID=UPI003D28F2C1
MEDKYRTFAYDYDEFGRIEEYLGAEKVFFQQLFSEKPVRTVLDCACGTGQHLYMMSEMGLEVVGSDYSEAMLEVAAKNLAALKKEIPLAQCDFRYLEKIYKEKFDAVVCLTTALPHLLSEHELLTALKSMKSRINDGGVLILTQGTTHYTLSLPSIEVVVNRSDFSRVFVKEQKEGSETIHVLDLYHSLKRTESNQYDIVYKIILDEDYHRLLTAAGFESIEIYGDYDRKPYDHESIRLIVVAQ